MGETTTKCCRLDAVHACTLLDAMHARTLHARTLTRHVHSLTRRQQRLDAARTYAYTTMPPIMS